jgi:multiple sugar transport system permease protein
MNKPITISRKKKKVKKEEVVGILLAILPVLRFLLFGLAPMILALVMAFLDMNTFSLKGAKFIGFANFKDVLSDDMFWKSIANTFYLSLSLPISIIIALLISVLLTKKIRFKKIFRTVYFIPFVCSVVAVTLMWRWLFDYNYGVINQIFKLDINWRSDPKWYIPGLIIMTVWSTTGYKIVILTAALTAVNPTYYEAAEIDGASAWRKFWHITLPSISPTLFFLVVTGVISILQEFSRSQVWNSNGGPNGKGLTIVFYLYRRAFEYIEMGPASAVAWLLAMIIAVITFINFKTSKKWVHYG